MRISIRKPLGYSQIGRKDRQEDAVWPSFGDITTENRCIVLCDGVGGSEHGEIASQTASKVIGEYLSKVIDNTGGVCEQDVQDAVNLAYDELERIDTEASEDGAVSMATTLICVCLHSEGVLAAHMGDSRIYHIRPGQGVLYESRDHSLLRALLDAGELNEEEAKNFPRKNVITKALQPHGQKRFAAEVRQLTDVQSGDYLFLCCDGVLEQLTVGNLYKILSMPCSDKEKIALLEAESTGKTKDNYTAYLIPIDSVEGASSLPNDENDISAEVDDIEVVAEEQDTKISAQEQLEGFPNDTVENSLLAPQKDIRNYYVIAIFVLAFVGLLIIYFSRLTTSEDDSQTPTEKIETIKQNSLDSLIQGVKDNPHK